MSFGAGMAAGIGCGIACGISAGRSQARKELAANLDRMESDGRLRIADGEGRPISADALLRDALPSREVADSRGFLIVALAVGLLMLGGLLTFYLMRR